MVTMETNKCDKGRPDGSCCCNCIYQIELFKHPWNKLHKGSVLESTGLYACIAPLDDTHINRGVIFEFKHSYCEVHTRRK